VLRKAVRITGTGYYLPENVMTNKSLFLSRIKGFRSEDSPSDLEDWQYFDEKVRQLTGISQRHYINNGETTESMALIAAQRAISAAGLEPSAIDYILVASTTPFDRIPNIACTLSHLLEIDGTPGFHLDTACSGFLYSLEEAYHRIMGGHYDAVLIVCAESISRHLNFSDFRTSILFGDGAAAVVVQPSENGGIKGPFYLKSRYSQENIVKKDSGAYCHGLFEQDDSVFTKKYFLEMQGGRHVMKAAVRTMTEATFAALIYDKFGKEYLKAHPSLLQGLTKNPQSVSEKMPDQAVSMEDILSEVDYFLPHQANQRITEGLAKRLLDPEMKRTISIIDQTGNISGTTMPLALGRAVAGDLLRYKIKRGDRIVLTAVGGGYTIGGVVLEF
jgi:3-oxoacyl-[acyl-carrier-protein] synthase-3